ncbi:MAG: PAS domain S-box protein [Armatimonadota bacterium]
MVCADTAGIVRFFNSAAERMLGYSADEVVGHLSSTVFHDPDELARDAASTNWGGNEAPSSRPRSAGSCDGRATQDSTMFCGTAMSRPLRSIAPISSRFQARSRFCAGSPGRRCARISPTCPRQADACPDCSTRHFHVACDG